MRFVSNTFWITGFSVLLISCGASHEEKEARERAVSDSVTTNGFISSSAAVETGKDTSHRFVRTAEMKFRVNNVYKATYQIEDITAQYGGFVTYSDLTSNNDDRDITPISADSSLETIHYTVSNSIILRVPNTKLDSTLRRVATLIDYLDYRRIKADDVKLLMISNQLTQERMKKPESQRTTVIESKDKKVVETRQSEEHLLYKQEQADLAKISNLSLQDQINFSTVTLSIYQRQETKRWIISNDKNIDAYEPGFGRKLIESLQYGWLMLESFLLIITKLWGPILFFVIAYILYRKYGYLIKSKK